MLRTSQILLSLLIGSTLAIAAPIRKVPAFASITELEQRLDEIDLELGQLANNSLWSGVGAVGFRSDSNENATPDEWIQIDLEEDTSFDQIVLVPTLWRTASQGFTADGFPIAFQILAGTTNDHDGTVIATYTKQDNLLPRIAPLVIPLPKTTASWVRLETIQMSTNIWNNKEILQLSEFMIFDGSENVALHKNVQVSSKGYGEGQALHENFLVDGFVPYLIDAAKGERSIAFVGMAEIGEQPTLTVDLKSAQPINRIHLHATDLSDTIPQVAPNNFGIPYDLAIEGANQPDFSDATLLVEYGMKNIYDVGPVIPLQFSETTCRYIRLTALVPYSGDFIIADKALVAFAEIEIFADGKNVALNSSVEADFEGISPSRQLSTLTDGKNFYGQIIPLREWLNQLALRHNLEQERPLIAAELSRRYAQQKTNLRRISWLATLLAVAIVIIILTERILHLRQIARIKERFAADLHDELGANIHTIGLLSDAASVAHDSPDEWSMIHRNIRDLTKRTGTAIRHCSNMLDAKNLYIGLVEDMKRSSKRIMESFDSTFEVEGEEFLTRLRPRTRVDLFLFYKECLINICRHSEGTNFSTHLVGTAKQVTLTIRDNGKGLSELPNGEPPQSLKRRARLLRAQLAVSEVETGGTEITLRLKPHKKWIPLIYKLQS